MTEKPNLLLPSDVKPFLVLISYTGGPDQEVYGQISAEMFGVSAEAAMLTACRQLFIAMVRDGIDPNTCEIGVDLVLHGHPEPAWSPLSDQNESEEDDGSVFQGGYYFPANDPDITP